MRNLLKILPNSEFDILVLVPCAVVRVTGSFWTDMSTRLSLHLRRKYASEEVR